MANYYNEFDPFAAEWLRELIKSGLIPDGEVDTRSIVDVRPDDLRKFTQCHFFAGIGGWSHALRLAGWADDRPIWTGSCPCQPFSVAGKGKGKDDERHLWPVFHQLITECRPPVVMGEQVAGKAGYGWFDGVRSDLEREGYASRAVDIPACAVNAPHIRQRIYWCAVGNADALRKLQPQGAVSEQRRRTSDTSGMDDTMRQRHGNEDTKVCTGRYAAVDAGWNDCDVANTDGSRSASWVSAQTRWGEGFAEITDNGSRGQLGPWEECEWLTGADGKARRVGVDFRLLAHGFSDRLERCGSNYISKASAEIEKHAKDFYQSRSQTMREVWEVIWSKPTSFWSMGKCPGVQPQEILFPFLRQLASSFDQAGESLSCEEIQRFEMRSLWVGAKTSCSSCEWKSSREYSREYSNSLHELSRILAQYAGEAWNEHRWENAKTLPLLTNGEKARVGKLRGYGNAIVPPLAAEVIKAFMETNHV